MTAGTKPAWAFIIANIGAYDLCLVACTFITAVVDKPLPAIAYTSSIVVDRRAIGVTYTSFVVVVRSLVEVL